MCELNPKRKAIYRLEFFTSQETSDAEWLELIVPRLIQLEEEFNNSGAVRVHIHDE